MPRTVLKVCEGVWWLRPILVLNLSLDQAEQKNLRKPSEPKKSPTMARILKKFILRP